MAPDGLLDLEEFVTGQVDRHEIVTLTERSDGLEAGGIQRDGRLRVVELLAFVQVGEAHDTTLRAVGAVAHNIDGDVGLHVLVDARTALVAPHDLTLALLERIVDARVVRVVGLVAGIDGAHAILVDANGHFRPVNIEVRRVGTPHGGQERGVLTVGRPVVVAVGTIDVEVVQGTGHVLSDFATAGLHDDVRAVAATRQAIGLSLDVVRTTVLVDIADSVEVDSLILPLDRAGPVAAVALHEDEDVALTVP